MVIDFVLSAFAGIAIGLLFPVLAVVPGVVAIGTIAAIAAVALGAGASTVAVAVGLSILALQIGYFFGALGSSLARDAETGVALQEVDVKSPRSAHFRAFDADRTPF